MPPSQSKAAFFFPPRSPRPPCCRQARSTGRGGAGLAAVAGALPGQVDYGKQNRLTMCGHMGFVAAHGKPSYLVLSNVVPASPSRLFGREGD